VQLPRLHVIFITTQHIRVGVLRFLILNASSREVLFRLFSSQAQRA
jgi:hypothetical protein